VVPLAADENVHGSIIRGLRRRQPDLDLIRIQDTELRGADDAVVLAWAAEQGRIVVTRDVATLIAVAYARVQSGQRMPGVFVVTDEIPVGRAIDDLELLATCSLEGEWENQVVYLPL
jgi:hypothetical protein